MSEVNEAFTLPSGLSPSEEAYSYMMGRTAAEHGLRHASDGWPKAGKLTYLYFMACRASCRVKIGITKNLKGRFQRFDTALPEGVAWIAFVPGDRKWEQILHKRFAADRLNGEWFRFSDGMASFIESLEPDVLSRETLAQRPTP